MWKGFVLVCLVLQVAAFSNEDSLKRNLGEVSIEGIMAHLDAFQAIANANGGNRAAQNPGYNASVDYVVSVLQAKTNYTITVQPFNFIITEENSSPRFSQVSPFPQTYSRYLEFNTLTYTGSGNVQAVATDGGDGCSPSSFVGFPVGHIAILARGDCDFSTKADNAVGAGAVGVIIYNYEGQGAFSGTLGSPKDIPVFGISYDLGRSFIDTSTKPTLSMFADMSVVTVYTSNVIAETTTGRSDKAIVVGSHLDSVPEGPGINDNGSGSATNLELATEIFRNNVTLNNQIRFAWWGAEELGLLGSTYYVEQAIASGDITNIALNLNFDMLGSPNYFRGVYDGEGAAENIRTGCVNIEHLFTTFFDFDGLPWNLTEFTGRSDYGPFIENNIPAGGLFTGAEVIKPNDYRIDYGGLANTAFDPCYHGHCDDIYNINQEVLISNAQAAYYALTSTAQNVFIDNWLTTPQTLSAERVRAAHHSLPSSPFFTKQ